MLTPRVGYGAKEACDYVIYSEMLTNRSLDAANIDISTFLARHLCEVRRRVHHYSRRVKAAQSKP